MQKKVFFILFICTVITTVPYVKICAQPQNQVYLVDGIVVNTTDQIDPINFNTKAFELILLDAINQVLEKRGAELFSTNNLLYQAALLQAEYMALTGDASVDRETKELTNTQMRLVSLGASVHAGEIVTRENLTKNNQYHTYLSLCDDIVLKWFAGFKSENLLISSGYNLCGISAKCDANKKRVFISMVLGSYKTMNNGAQFIDNLNVPYSTKTYGLKPGSEQICKKIWRADGLPDLQKGLYTNDKQIYLKLDNAKPLTRLLKDKKDGIAVDILQKEQFTCQTDNIVDHNFIHQGYLTKMINVKKITKNNIADTKNQRNALHLYLGDLPEGISDNYELNLVIINDKNICISIPNSFIIQTTGTYTRKVQLLADTVTINSKFSYKPVADSLELSLKIPFENKKSSYKTEDIEPFIKLLNEPAFIIYELNISAYSSVEGNDQENLRLQQKRAQSIINALEERQKKQIKTNIVTSYNWDDFARDIKQTQHNILASMPVNEAQDYIRTYGLKKELEPILQNHRYAKIDMKVTYDITGENEKPYVLKKFNQAIDDKDLPLALSIEKYIMKQIINKRYLPATVNELSIPLEPQFAGLVMNKLWLLHNYKFITTDDFAYQVAMLNSLAPDNQYIAFNNLFLTITQGQYTNLSEISVIQPQINRLYYNTSLSKETVDGLNIRHQFKMLNAADSVFKDPRMREECIEQIKSIVDISEETLPNSLKLAELFIDNGDYNFALKTLEPWVDMPMATDDLLFAYVSLCSRYDFKMHTKKFTTALLRARELNPQKFCELLNGGYFSLRVFENQQIKSAYCKYCNIDDDMAGN